MKLEANGIVDAILRRIFKDIFLRRIFKNSMILFSRGKLFRSLFFMFKQWLKGVLLTLALLLPVGYFVSPLAGIIVASLVGGAIQPWLYQDLKYL